MIPRDMYDPLLVDVLVVPVIFCSIRCHVQMQIGLPSLCRPERCWHFGA